MKCYSPAWTAPFQSAGEAGNCCGWMQFHEKIWKRDAGKRGLTSSSSWYVCFLIAGLVFFFNGEAFGHMNPCLHSEMVQARNRLTFLFRRLWEWDLRYENSLGLQANSNKGKVANQIFWMFVHSLAKGAMQWIFNWLNNLGIHPIELTVAFFQVIMHRMGCNSWTFPQPSATWIFTIGYLSNGLRNEPVFESVLHIHNCVHHTWIITWC